jgi:AraC family ethanolamine operon transcriptional activator
VEQRISQHHFSNFEVFSSVLSGYDIDIKQIDHGSFSAFLQQIQCGPVAVNRFSLTRRVEINGNPPPGLRTFGVPTSDCQPFVWRGKKSSGNTIQIYKPSTELALITHPEFEAIDISITEKDFDALNQLWGFPALDSMIGNMEILNCNPAIMFSLRTTLGHICSITENNPERFYQDIELQNIVKHQVPYLLAQALMSAEAHSIKATANTKSQTIKTVIDYIQSLPNKNISIEMICSDTGINIRTLQRAFLEKYGVTPKSYLQSQRLNEAYKALLDSDPKTAKIRDIALSQGYWHMSQFAADYRRQFGELPSKTLAQHR